VGRFEHEDSTLVDVEEVQVLLRKSRRTVFYLISRGRLTPRYLEGSKKTWLELTEVMGLAKVNETSGGPQMSERLRAHLSRHHPWALT
jgi:hypothetical protein